MRLRHSSINHSAVQDNSDCPRIISNPLMACFAFLKNASQPFFAGGLFFNLMQTKRDWFAAMDSWLAWWEKTGRAEFANRHPEVTSLFVKLDPEDALKVAGQLPANILAISPAIGKEYTLSSSNALSLARAGKLRLRLLGNGAIGRFLDPEAEHSLTTNAPKVSDIKTNSNFRSVPR